jgi:DNA-binding PadR family transcriptional regulator
MVGHHARNRQYADRHPRRAPIVTAVGLLVLGAIRRRGRSYGYQVRADLKSWGAHEWATARPGSVYHALKTMAERGLLRAREKPSDAGGPPRIEYALTTKGRTEYRARLRRALAARDPRLDLLAAAVGLIDDLPRREAVTLLRKRAESMDAWHSAVAAHIPPGTKLEDWGPVGEVASLWLHTAQSRAEWTRQLIGRLERGLYRMADEKQNLTQEGR